MTSTRGSERTPRGGSDSGGGGGDYTGATASVNMSTAQFQALCQAVRPPNPPQPAPHTKTWR